MESKIASILFTTLRTALSVGIVLAIMIIGPGRCMKSALHAATTTANTPAPSTHVAGLAAFEGGTQAWSFQSDDETASRTQRISQPTLSPLSQASFTAGDCLPLGFVPINAESSEMEAYLVGIDLLLRQNSGMRTICLAVPRGFRDELHLVDRELNRLKALGRESSTLLEEQFSQLTLDHHVAIVEFKDTDRITIAEFNAGRRIIQSQLESLMEAALQEASQSSSEILTRFAGEEVEIDLSISEPRVLSESPRHLTVILGVQGSVTADAEQENSSSIALMSLVYLDGRMLAVYSYVPNGDAKSLEAMTVWLDEVVGRLTYYWPGEFASNWSVADKNGNATTPGQCEKPNRRRTVHGRDS